MAARGMPMNRLFLGLPAPAKLNLFLHVTGRRADGYHELQSVMVPIDLADTLDFELCADGRIERDGDLIGPLEGDLCLRAAQALQRAAGTPLGASIRVDKRIPAGSGLGGGSSDAATTLLALNRLWRLDWSRAQLAAIGLQLGADVPFFLGPGPAWVEGIGQRLAPLAIDSAWFALIHPQVHVSTAEIFNDPGLTRNTNPLIIAAFSESRLRSPHALFGANDLEPVVRRRVAQVDAALNHLGRFAPARLTGSGSAVFAPMASHQDAHNAVRDLPAGWSGWAVRSLTEHPLNVW